MWSREEADGKTANCFVKASESSNTVPQSVTIHSHKWTFK